MEWKPTPLFKPTPYEWLLLCYDPHTEIQRLICGQYKPFAWYDQDENALSEPNFWCELPPIPDIILTPTPGTTGKINLGEPFTISSVHPDFEYFKKNEDGTVDGLTKEQLIEELCLNEIHHLKIRANDLKRDIDEAYARLWGKDE